MVSVLGMDTFGERDRHTFVQHNPGAARCGNICPPASLRF